MRSVPGACLVDTDVLSFTLRDDTRARYYEPLLQDRRLLISFMTLAELEQWALQRNWGIARRRRMERMLESLTVVPYEVDLCSWWAAVRVGSWRAGCPIEVADAWIAATARLYGVPLVTHNPSDYAGVEGLVVLTAAGSADGRDDGDGSRS